MIETSQRSVCIVINGPSAVGKSTLVTRIQDQSPIPLLRFGVDEFYRTVPGEWAGGKRDAKYRDAGFSYQDVRGADGQVHRMIVNGSDALHMLMGMNGAIGGLLKSGNHVIVDGEAYVSEIHQDLHQSLALAQKAGTAEVSVISLTCSPDNIVERQDRHSRPVGISLGQLMEGPLCSKPDLLLDTADTSADVVFTSVWSWLVARHSALTLRP